MTYKLSTAISFDLFQWIDPHSPITVFQNIETSFFDEKKTKKEFLLLAKTMYIPILTFMLEQKINIFLIITGKFLEMAVQCKPEIITLIQKLDKNNLVQIVVNEYSGASASSLYNSEYWAKGIEKTKNLVTKHIGVTPQYIFLHQLFRGLELEKVIDKTSISNFLLTHKSKKYLQFESSLLDLRRFNGKRIHWLEKKDNATCTFKFIDQKYLFEVNGNIFQKDQKQAVKTFSLAVGFFSSEFEIRKQLKKIKESRQSVRFAEKPNKMVFSVLEKGVLRLVEYGLGLIQSYPNIFLNNPEYKLALKDFEAIHRSEFLFFLNKDIYLTKKPILFGSPYEAFITVQAIITKLELIVEINQAKK